MPRRTNKYRLGGEWLYQSPGELPDEARERFFDLILTTCEQADTKELLEIFARAFARVAKYNYTNSTTEDWALSDWA